jgi:hypothetical protein
MNILAFYEKLSKLMGDWRVKSITTANATEQLKSLLKEAADNKLDVNISLDMLKDDNKINLDEEESYEETYEDSYEDSYDDDDC